MNITQSKATLINYENEKIEIPLPITNHRRLSSLVFTIDPPNSVDIEDALSL